jgi:hypothetical protein
MVIGLSSPSRPTFLLPVGVNSWSNYGMCAGRGALRGQPRHGSCSLRLAGCSFHNNASLTHCSWSDLVTDIRERGSAGGAGRSDASVESGGAAAAAVAAKAVPRPCPNAQQMCNDERRCYVSGKKRRHNGKKRRHNFDVLQYIAVVCYRQTGRLSNLRTRAVVFL